MPYLAMQDRLRSFLGRGQAVLITCGYSFADQHLNEVILHGLRSNPTAICFGLLFGNRADYPEAISKAAKHPNLSLLAADGAVLGTLDKSWKTEEQRDHPLHNVSVIKRQNNPAAPEEISSEFKLGDFKYFGDFLARQLAWTGDDQVTQNAP
jgi:hypothetical protein